MRPWQVILAVSGLATAVMTILAGLAYLAYRLCSAMLEAISR